MPDYIQALLWLVILSFGALFCIIAYSRGLAVTYIRDLLHVGTGMWILGFPLWQKPYYPMAIVTVAFLLTIALPFIGKKLPKARKFIESVSNSDESWLGIELYVFSYMLFTACAFTYDKFYAASALWVLSLGDGIGGFIGRKFGKISYKLPWTKTKTIEGSIAVFAFSLCAIICATYLFNVPLNINLLVTCLLSALLASIIEAISPKTSDNVFVPLFVFFFLVFLPRTV